MQGLPLFSKARFCTYDQRDCENVEVSQYLSVLEVTVNTGTQLAAILCYLHAKKR